MITPELRADHMRETRNLKMTRSAHAYGSGQHDSAQALSPNLGQQMMAARLLGKAVVMRELMPQDLKLEVGDLSRSRAMALAAYLRAVVGKAHGRQMSLADRASWLADLTKSHTVDRLAVHERAYLEHCRVYVLAQAA